MSNVWNQGSPSRSMLEDLWSSLQFDERVLAHARPLIQASRSQASSAGIRGCLFLAHHVVSPMPVNLSLLLGGPRPISSKEFIDSLKPLLDNLQQLPAAASEAARQFLSRNAICLELASKFREVWNKLLIDGRRENLETAFQSSWLLFINARSSLLKKSTTRFDNYCLMVGFLHYLLNNLPANLRCAPAEALPALHALMKQQAKVAEEWALKVEGFVKRLSESNVSSEDLAGLRDWYAKDLGAEDVDERTLAKTSSIPSTPLKKRTYQTGRGELNMDGRILQWDQLPEPASFEGKLEDFRMPPPSPNVGLSTPMTMASEANYWLSGLMERESCAQALQEGLQAWDAQQLDKIEAQLVELFLSHGVVNFGSSNIIQELFVMDDKPAEPVSTKNYRVAEVLNLLCKVLLALMETGGLKEGKAPPVRALAVCCVEAYLYVREITLISMTDALKALDVSFFSLWKVIPLFLKFDARLPMALKWHFREIEAKLIACLSWSDDELFKKNLQKEGDGAHARFFKRLFSHSAHRLIELANYLALSESLRENAWVAVKYLLLNKLEMLRFRHVDQMVICSIYGACKGHSEVSFSRIVDCYRKLFSEDQSVYMNVFIENGDFDTIIKFYNKVYMPSMKVFLTDLHNGNIASPMYQQHPLRACAPSAQMQRAILSSLKPLKSLKSPFMTPRTQKLYSPCSPLSIGLPIQINPEPRGPWFRNRDERQEEVQAPVLKKPNTQ